jgi:hypothetical protein
MKKLVFGLIATVLFAGVTNAQDKVPVEGLTVEYYKYVFDKSPIGKETQVINVSNLSNESYKKIINHMSEVSFNESKYAVNIDLLHDGQKKSIVVLPLADGRSSIGFLQNENLDEITPIKFTVEKDGTYKYEPFATRRGVRISRDCATGAGQIANLGGAFASLSLIGCVPCGFAGGAVAGIAMAMSLFC